MANFRSPGFAKYDGYDIKTQRLIFDAIGFEEYPGGSVHFMAFFSIDGGVCRGYGFIAPRLDFDKNKSALAICYDQVDFAIGAAVVADDCFIAFGFEIFLAASLTPPAEFLRVSQKPSPVKRQDEHGASPLTWSQYVRCAAVRAGRPYHFAL